MGPGGQEITAKDHAYLNHKTPPYGALVMEGELGGLELTLHHTLASANW